MANMNFGVNILPKANNTYTLGNSDYKWNIFANTINGTSVSTLLSNMITDIQIDGTSIISNGTATIPIASTTNYGLVKIGGGLHLEDNYLQINEASLSLIKAGTTYSRVIVPSHQHESVFYGLAKAAGDSTQSASSNVVGVYTDSAKTAIQNMLNVASKDDLLLKVDKTAIDNTGITGSTYTAVLGGEFTVTTATDANDAVPHARASVTGRFDKRKRYRITVNNGTPIIIETRLWFEWVQGGYKIFEYLGNINKYDNNNSNYIPTSQTKYPTWLIISDLNDNSSIDIWTTSAGTYTFLIEEVVDTFNQLPRNLVYGSCYEPILTTTNGGSTYTNFSIGVNKFTSYRGNVAIGYANIHSGTFSITIGDKNEAAEGSNNYIIGYGNDTHGYNNYISGTFNTIRGDYSSIIGTSNYCQGNRSHIEGYWNVAYDSDIHIEGRVNIGGAYASHVEGMLNTSQGFIEHVGGINSITQSYPEWVASTSYIVGDVIKNPSNQYVQCIQANSDSTYDKDKWLPIKTYLEKIGNGEFDLNTKNVGNSSNARTLDWNGNERLNGTLYINCNADSSGGIEVATLSDIASAAVEVIRL